MDATSADETGFDAALKALEDLESSVAQTREELATSVSAPAPSPAMGSISLSDEEPEAEPPASIAPAGDEPIAITALPVAEFENSAAMPEPHHHDVERVASIASPGAVPSAPPLPIAPVATGKLGKVLIGAALLSSLLSAVGLIVAERTIVSAQLVVATARERADQLETANKLIRDLEVIREKQIELLQRQQAQLASAPVTSDELQRKMDSLQTGLMQRDPLNDVIVAIRAGQNDTNARFNAFGLKIDRLEAAIGH